jgi:hypothetical protein
MKTLIETHIIDQLYQVKVFECTNYDYVGYHWELWQSTEKIADSYEEEPCEEKINALSDAMNVFHNFFEE